MNDSAESHSVEPLPSQSKFSQDTRSKVSLLATASFLLGALALLLTAIPALLCGILALGKIASSNGKLKGKSLAITGMAMAVLLSAVKLSALWIYREKARDALALNNARQIALGCFNFNSAFRKLPTDLPSRDTGEPLLSWRVLILPYIEQSELYNRFNRNEPWDSPHNLEAAKDMPDLFHRPGLDLEDGMTVYQRPVGDNALFPPKEENREQSIRLRDITDGLAQTIMIVETSEEEAVFWTKPADYQYDKKNPMRGLGAGWTGKLVFAFADGSCLAVPRNRIDEETLRQVFSRNGGEKPVLTDWRQPLPK